MQPRSKMSFYHDKHGACITISFLNCIWSNENKPNIYVGANCLEECKKNKKKIKYPFLWTLFRRMLRKGNWKALLD